MWHNLLVCRPGLAAVHQADTERGVHVCGCNMASNDSPPHSGQQEPQVLAFNINTESTLQLVLNIFRDLF